LEERIRTWKKERLKRNRFLVRESTIISKTINSSLQIIITMSTRVGITRIKRDSKKTSDKDRVDNRSQCIPLISQSISNSKFQIRTTGSNRLSWCTLTSISNSIIAKWIINNQWCTLKYLNKTSKIHSWWTKTFNSSSNNHISLNTSSSSPLCSKIP
jgi:hypothetical protein